MKPEADRKAYFRAIEEEFARHRGAPMLLSPRDWSLVGEWHQAHIPLWLVLQGMQNVFNAFARRGPQPRRINSLSYCRQEIETLFDLYRALRAAEAGRPRPEGGEQTGRLVSRHIGRLIRRLREAMARASAAGHDSLVGSLASAAAEIKRLRKDSKSGAIPPDQLEDLLRQVDSAALEGARASLTAEESAWLEAETERRVVEQKDRMTSEGYAATRQAIHSSLLRQQRHMPRLSLFD
jgi:hypothetical protein